MDFFFVSSIIIGTRGFNMIIIMCGFYHCVGRTWKKPQLVIVKLQPNLGKRPNKNLQIYWKMYSFSGSLSFINWICDDILTHSRWLVYSISKMSIKTCLQSNKCDCVKNNLKPHKKNTHWALNSLEAFRPTLNLQVHGNWIAAVKHLYTNTFTFTCVNVCKNVVSLRSVTLCLHKCCLVFGVTT